MKEFLDRNLLDVHDNIYSYFVALSLSLEHGSSIWLKDVRCRGPEQNST